MITEKDAIALINLAESLEINVFIDGGWGVDALLGEQTREHQDIDLFVEERQAARFIHALHQQGFKERTEAYSTPNHIVFADADRRTVSAGRVISARRKYPASLRRHKSLSIQDMLLMTMISEMCLPYAAVFISPFQMNICLMQINPKSPK